MTSIDGVVSKLSERLQHAAFNSSSDDIFKIFAELNRETEDDLVLYLMETAFNSVSAFNIILAFDDAYYKKKIITIHTSTWLEKN